MTKNTVPSNHLNYELKSANMYGCQPCPKCSSKMRWVQNDPISKLILCDDCGFSEEAANDPNLFGTDLK